MTVAHPLLTAAVFASAFALSACSSVPKVPAGAESVVRTESNGDVIEEFRVGGRLHTVRVTPVRGPTYYLTDADGDGMVDRAPGGVSPVYFKLFSF